MGLDELGGAGGGSWWQEGFFFWGGAEWKEWKAQEGGREGTVIGVQAASNPPFLAQAALHGLVPTKYLVQIQIAPQSRLGLNMG